MKEYPLNKISRYILEGYKIDENSEFTVEVVPARKLICKQRIDLMAKYLLLEARDMGLDVSFYETLYAEHISAFTHGTYQEPGNSKKSSLDAYLKEFYTIIESIRKYGFDEKISLIPTGKNYEILDGSHRVSVAAYYDLDVKIVRFAKIERNFDAEFFESRGLKSKYLDLMVNRYLQFKENIYVAIFWPAARDLDIKHEAIERIGKEANIVYQKDIHLTPNGLKNIVRQVYDGQEWIGNAETMYFGANRKAYFCSSNNNILSVVFFECEDLSIVLKMKKEIRERFDIQNHSVHITDNASETRQVAKLLLNKNSIYFANYGNPDIYNHSNVKFDYFRKCIKEQKLTEKCIVDSSMILSLFGIREARDLDYLCIDNLNPELPQGMDNHESELKYYTKDKTNLIYDPNNFFTYFGIKCLTLERLKEMKLNRNEQKDILDVEKIEQFEKKVNNVEMLQFNDGVVIGNDLYFVMSNSNALYRYTDGKTEIVLDEPFVENGVPKFCKLLKYKDYIIFIPMCMDCFFKYDYKKNKLFSYQIGYASRKSFSDVRYRDAKLINGQIWLLPNAGSNIEVLNPDSMETQVIDNWPKEFARGDKDSNMFYCMDYAEPYIYLFRNAADSDYKINIYTKEIEKIDFYIPGRYKAIVKDKFVSYSDRGNCIQIHNEKGEFLKQIEIPSGVKRDDKDNYQFWHIRSVNEMIIICPYYANAIILLDSDLNNISCIKLDKYFNPEGVRVWNAVEYNGEVVLFAEGISFLLRIDGEEIKEIPYEFLADQLKHHCNNYYEIVAGDLNAYIKKLC